MKKRISRLALVLGLLGSTIGVSTVVLSESANALATGCVMQSVLQGTKPIGAKAKCDYLSVDHRRANETYYSYVQVKITCDGHGETKYSNKVYASGVWTNVAKCPIAYDIIVNGSPYQETMATSTMILGQSLNCTCP